MRFLLILLVLFVSPACVGPSPPPPPPYALRVLDPATVVFLAPVSEERISALLVKATASLGWQSAADPAGSWTLATEEGTLDCRLRPEARGVDVILGFRDDQGAAALEGRARALSRALAESERLR